MNVDNPEENNDTDDSEFAQAFAEHSADTAGPTSPPVPARPDEEQPTSEEPSGPGSEPPPAPAQSDPWANAPQELLAERNRLTEENNRHRGRQAALQRQIDELRRKEQQAQQPKPPAAGDEQSEDDGLARLREEYPDVAEPILKKMAALEARIAANEGFASTVQEDRQAEHLAAELSRLGQAHPDYAEYALGSPKRAILDTWLADQPPGVKALMDSDSAGDTGILLTLFKQQQAPNAEAPAPAPAPDPRRQKQLAGSREVGSKPAPAATGAPTNYEDAFAYYQRIADKELAASRV